MYNKYITYITINNLPHCGWVGSTHKKGIRDDVFKELTRISALSKPTHPVELPPKVLIQHFYRVAERGGGEVDRERGGVENFMTNLLCTRPGYLQRWLKVCALQTPSQAAQGAGLCLNYSAQGRVGYMAAIAAHSSPSRILRSLSRG